MAFWGDGQGQLLWTEGYLHFLSEVAPDVCLCEFHRLVLTAVHLAVPPRLKSVILVLNLRLVICCVPAQP
jgi:hypothetical protein